MVPSNKHIECLINAMHEIGISHKKNLLNLVSRAIVQAREQEREEIARELHDNINQLIMASKLMIDTARKEERQRQTLLKKSAATLEEVIHEIRRLSGSMTTPHIKDFCLLEAIDQLICTISSCKKMRIVLKYDHMIEGLLDLEQKKQVYRIIQEQFNNIIKHAAASKAVLLIEYRKDTVRIKIKDNGVGFDLTQKRNGIGLANIGKRVALLKGDLNILSAINQGSTLDVWFRVNAA
jgi:signal transduction histidine kinase